MAKQATKREVTVLVRYEIKQDCPAKGLHKGDVVLYVQNDKGDRYYTTLRRSKHHSCSCKANAEYGKTCYHISQCREMENARYTASKVIELPARPVISKVVDIRERRDMLKAPLNGNRPFSILKVS